MARRPLIGLTGRRTTGDNIAGNLTVLDDHPIDLYYALYQRAVLAAGAMPFPIAFEADPADVVDHLDGLLICGGADVSPDRYGAEASPDTIDPEPERDAVELALLDHAFAARLPTLGICRGIQILNVHAGGTLVQHVPAHAGLDGAADAELHDVAFTDGSALASIYGPRRAVNSLHHQALDHVAPDYTVTGVAPDGGVEAIEHLEAQVIGVQWHPEMMRGAPSDPIFGWLVDAARAHRQSKA